MPNSTTLGTHCPWCRKGESLYVKDDGKLYHVVAKGTKEERRFTCHNGNLKKRADEVEEA